METLSKRIVRRFLTKMAEAELTLPPALSEEARRGANIGRAVGGTAGLLGGLGVLGGDPRIQSRLPGPATAGKLSRLSWLAKSPKSALTGLMVGLPFLGAGAGVGGSLGKAIGAAMSRSKQDNNPAI